MAQEKNDEKDKIFRKVAMERLSSPEQLDLLMTVTSPRTWIALAGLAVLVCAVIVWSFLGTIPTKVSASGILIRPGGLFDVFVRSPGQVADVLVAEGDTVSAGQLVARVDQPDLTRQIGNTRMQLRELQEQHRQVTSFASRDMTLRDDSQVLREAQLKDTIAFAESRIAALQEQIAGEEALLEKGLLTRQTVLQTRQQLFAAQDLLERSRGEVRQIPLEKLTNTTAKQQEALRSQLQINEAERTIALLERQLDEASTVTTPYSGRVVEVKLDRGSPAGPGTALLSIEVTGLREGLQAIVYVPPSSGKNVATGMVAQVSPTTVPREEFGFLIGKVTYVSEFPATSEGMMRVLSNPGLVQTLSAQGPPFAVYADLEPNPIAPGRYRWSSPKGDELSVNSGTICNVTITVRERRPIELVIPTIRQYLGL